MRSDRIRPDPIEIEEIGLEPRGSEASRIIFPKQQEIRPDPTRTDPTGAEPIRHELVF